MRSGDFIWPTHSTTITDTNSSTASDRRIDLEDWKVDGRRPARILMRVKDDTLYIKRSNIESDDVEEDYTADALASGANVPKLWGNSSGGIAWGVLTEGKRYITVYSTTGEACEVQAVEA